MWEHFSSGSSGYDQKSLRWFLKNGWIRTTGAVQIFRYHFLEILDPLFFLCHQKFNFATDISHMDVIIIRPKN